MALSVADALITGLRIPSLTLEVYTNAHHQQPQFNNMAPLVLPSILIASTYLISTVSAVPSVNELVGTWSTKSAAVLTGPVCCLGELGFESVDGHTLISRTRAFTIRSMIHYWSLPILEYRILSPQMVTMKKHTTERSPIVCIHNYRMANTHT